MEGLSEEKQSVIRALADAMGKTPEQLINETIQNKMKKDLSNMVENDGSGLMRYAMRHDPNPEIREIVKEQTKVEEKPKQQRKPRFPKAEKKVEITKKVL